MGSKTNQAIDSVIDQKLNKSFIVKSTRQQLLKYTKYDAVKNASLISDLMGVNSIMSQKDDYDNEICNFLNYKTAKTQSSFNILKLFKPGEILSTIIRC